MDKLSSRPADLLCPKHYHKRLRHSSDFSYANKVQSWQGLIYVDLFVYLCKAQQGRIPVLRGGNSLAMVMI